MENIQGLGFRTLELSVLVAWGLRVILFGFRVVGR